MDNITTTDIIITWSTLIFGFIGFCVSVFGVGWVLISIWKYFFGPQHPRRKRTFNPEMPKEKPKTTFINNQVSKAAQPRFGRVESCPDCGGPMQAGTNIHDCPKSMAQEHKKGALKVKSISKLMENCLSVKTNTPEGKTLGDTFKSVRDKHEY